MGYCRAVLLGSVRKAMRSRVLVVNGKGGCGKTTVATNLASTIANRGQRVALMDYEREACASAWLGWRGHYVPSITCTQGASMYETTAFSLRIPPGHDCMVIDGSSGLTGSDQDLPLQQADLVLVPLMPSPFDLEATARFLAELRASRSVRRRRVAIAVIVMRLPECEDRVARFAESVRKLAVPCAAVFRDHPVYNAAAAKGLGISEVAGNEDERVEAAAWERLVDDWVMVTSEPSVKASTNGTANGHAGTQPQARKLELEPMSGLPRLS